MDFINKPIRGKVVQRAFELGIKYVNIAKLSGDSKEKIEATLKDVSEESISATKTRSITKNP